MRGRAPGRGASSVLPIAIAIAGGKSQPEILALPGVADAIASQGSRNRCTSRGGTLVIRRKRNLDVG